MENTKTKTCGRCNGTGSYSYNPRYGTMCFACGGTGTKGGKASKASIPTPHGCWIKEYPFNLGWYVFIPSAPKSQRGVTVEYKTKEAALADYPNAEAR
jgi:hypothetical protein